LPPVSAVETRTAVYSGKVKLELAPATNDDTVEALVLLR
jgi:hypothetical protein